jgi:hypothetical protein
MDMRFLLLKCLLEVASHVVWVLLVILVVLALPPLLLVWHAFGSPVVYQ